MVFKIHMKSNVVQLPIIDKTTAERNFNGNEYRFVSI